MAGKSPSRAAELIRLLRLKPHPEGGHYSEVFRSSLHLLPADGRIGRVALTMIDFVLSAPEYSAWHRVFSDEAWSLLEGGPLRLWLVTPDFADIRSVDLARPGSGLAPRAVVPAHWWQAAEPLGEYAYVSATVAPGFEFDDFRLGRDDSELPAALDKRNPALRRLL